MKKLSAYTIAKNCADIKDLRAGITEIQNEIIQCDQLRKKVPNYYYIRLYKLIWKLDAKIVASSIVKNSPA